jgi:Zn-finger nucleic acid-binding protein
MTLNEIKLGKLARNATRMIVALLAVGFVGGSLSHATPQRGDEVYCASDNGRRNFCSADTRGGVRLVRQKSDSPCIAGRTWGFDRRSIWVDRGCRADFVTGDRNRDYGRDRDYDRDRGRDRDYDRDRGRDRDYGRDRGRDSYVQTFYCESGDGRRHYCSEGARGSVRLVRQKSGSPCIFGRTWGRDNAGVWVDRGCRADFEVRR